MDKTKSKPSKEPSNGGARKNMLQGWPWGFLLGSNLPAFLRDLLGST